LPRVTKYTFWLFGLAMMIVSLLFGCLAIKLRKYEVTIIGGIGGYFLGIYFINTFVIW
jgi:hypothetical protein